MATIYIGKDNPITLVDIDDKSLKAEGRWPWPRNKVADLVKKLYQNEAAVVAFDITFTDPEINMAEEVIDEMKKNHDTLSPEALSQLTSVEETFDYDALFAKSLQLGDSILGMVFIDQGETAGALPPPILQLTPTQEAQLAIPNKKNYLANIPKLEAASKTEGFINATPDSDGVLRFTPLLLRKDANVYGSLALQEVSLSFQSKNKSCYCPLWQLRSFRGNQIRSIIHPDRCLRTDIDSLQRSTLLFSLPISNRRH